MIIDFRVQPPFRSLLDTRVRRFKSAELFVEEMDELGVDVAVIMGQQSGATWGIVDNADIAELSDRYPGRFVGFAGVERARPERLLWRNAARLLGLPDGGAS